MGDQIEALLAEADRHISEGNTDAALEVIRRAQALDRENSYALAYVERIQSLMALRKTRGVVVKGGSQWAPASAVQKAAAAARPDRPQEATAKGHDARDAALKHAVEAILARAKEYAAGGNPERAAAEIARAQMLDPAHPGIAAVEAEISDAARQQQARALELQERRQREEEEKKKELVEQEVARVRQQKEEKRQKEDEARRSAQEQKIRQYLELAEQYLGEGRFEEASDQLAFVVVVDPLNAGAEDLQRKIREAQEMRRKEEEDRRRRKEEEERLRGEALQSAIRRNIETATALWREEKHAEALRSITRAYMLDPLNEEVRACEQKILEGQEESYRRAQEARRAEDEAARQRQEEELRRLTEAERERLVREQEAQLEQERQANREKVARYLSRAREHLARQSYHDALAEIAQAFAADPFDEDIKVVEQEILAAQRSARAVEPSAPDVSSALSGSELERYVEAAQLFRSKGEYARALDELTKAFVIDPLNEQVRTLEAEIEGEYRSSSGAASGAARPADPNVVDRLQSTLSDLTTQLRKRSPEAEGDQEAKLRYHAGRARMLLDAGQHEDALAEVALGLTIDAENAELRAIESEVWERQGAGTPGTTTEGPADELVERLQEHLAAAEELQRRGELVRALDEIAKAYQIDPLNEAARDREAAIRRDAAAKGQQVESQLKLVYPRHDAAGGA
jgi:Flp pilus assembly protein TadD